MKSRLAPNSMFLIEKIKHPDSQRNIRIYMRPDGMFEGRLYHRQIDSVEIERDSYLFDTEYEVCGFAETLSRIKVIINELLDE